MKEYRDREKAKTREKKKNYRSKEKIDQKVINRDKKKRNFLYYYCLGLLRVMLGQRVATLPVKSTGVLHYRRGRNSICYNTNFSNNAQPNRSKQTEKTTTKILKNKIQN